MDAYTAKYNTEGFEQPDATVVLMKDRISIGLVDESGNPRVVYWPYDQVIRDTFWKRGQAVVRCGTYPVQSIEVSSKEFADKLEAIFKHREKSWIRRNLNKNVFGLAKLILVFTIVILSSYFWLIPFLAERMAKRVPVSYEERLGNGIYESLKSGFTLDEAKTVYINDFFRELKISTKYNIRITVVNNDLANAYAIPGGHIVVHDKILAGMNDYEDLAALLSHEFSHINERHTTRALFRQLASGIFLSVILGDAGAIAGALVQNADQLKSLNYSRKLEKEADLAGLKILSERNIDGNGFVRLFELLKKETLKSGDQPAEWISSHPDLDNRISYIKSSEYFNQSGVKINETLRVLFLKIKTGD